MIKGHGVDIVSVARMRRLISRHGEKFLKKFFGPQEVEAASRYKDPAPFIASRFAAKEAFSKAVGTGFTGFGLSDVVVVREEGSPPSFLFSERLKKRLPEAVEKDFTLSISHERDFAVASVIWAYKA